MPRVSELSDPESAAARAAVADGHDLARGAATNALVLVAANFRAVFTFLIARVLGEASLGRFGLAFAATDLLSKVGALGFDPGIVPLVAARAALGDGEGCRRLFRTAVLWGIAVSAVLAAIAIPVANWLADARGFEAFSGGGTLMFLALPAIAVARAATSASRALLSMRNEFYSRGLTETWVTIAVFVAAVALGVRDRAPALALVAGSTAAALVAWTLAWRRLASVPGAFAEGRRSTFSMLRFVSPIAGTNLLNTLVMQLDILLLGAFVGRAPGVTVASFGVFAAAAEIAGGMRKVRQAFDPIFAPVVARRSFSADAGTLRATLDGPGRWVLAAQLPLVGVLLVASGAVLGVYGPQFRAGALWLAILALAHGTNSFAGLVETLLMVERPGLNLINAMVTIAVQLIAGLILIPKLGVTGAALAMLVAFALQGALRFAEMRAVFGWGWPWASLRRPALAFAVAVLPALAVRLAGGLLSEVLAAAVFLVSYALAWRRLGADPADREIWRRLLASMPVSRPRA